MSRNYIIEGTISELSYDEKFFTICGTEGFAIKLENKKYNIFLPSAPPEEKYYKESFIASQKCKFSLKKNQQVLLEAISNNKRIRVVLSEEKLTQSIDKNEEIQVSSITLLAD